MRSLPLAGVFCLALSFAAVGCDDDNDGGTGGTGATPPDVFTIALLGANEVPPTNTGATGTAILTINGSTVDYRVEVQNINEVRAGHIHSGVAGVNGPVRVPLIAAPVPGVTTGVIAQGSFSATEVAGITYDELIAEIRAGTAYVNVHTAAYPAGEIRGQTRSVPAN